MYNETHNSYPRVKRYLHGCIIQKMEFKLSLDMNDTDVQQKATRVQLFPYILSKNL